MEPTGCFFFQFVSMYTQVAAKVEAHNFIRKTLFIRYTVCEHAVCIELRYLGICCMLFALHSACNYTCNILLFFLIQKQPHADRDLNTRWKWGPYPACRTHLLGCCCLGCQHKVVTFV